MNSCFRRYAIFVTILLSLLYVRTIHSPFSDYDDSVYIQDNPIVTSPSLSVSQILHTFPASEFTPITSLTNRILFNVGEGSPIPFRIFSLLLHLSNVLLLYLILESLGLAPFFCAFCSFLFAIHPIQTETVVWISARKDLQGAFFLLLSVYLLLKEKYLPLPFLSLLAFLSKPSFIILGPLLFCIDRFILKERTKSLSQNIYVWVCMGISIIGFFVALHVANLTHTLQPSEGNTLLGRCLLTLTLLSKIYLKNVLIGYPLLPLYDEPKSIYTFNFYQLLTICTFIGAYFIQWSKPILLVVLLSVFALLPYLNFFPVNLVASDHYFYLTLFGLVFGFVALVFKFLPLKIANIVVFVFSLFFSTQTFRQVSLWKHEEFLWKKVIDQYPDSFKGRSIYASTLSKNGKIEDAIPQFKLLLEKSPQDVSVRTNLGMTYFVSNQYKNALSEFEILSKQKDSNVIPFYYLGKIHFRLGEFKKAKDSYILGLTKNPNHVESLYDLGLVFAELKSIPKAKEMWEKALKVSPSHYRSAYNLGVLYGIEKDFNHSCAYTQIAEINCKRCELTAEIMKLKKLSCSKI